MTTLAVPIYRVGMHPTDERPRKVYALQITLRMPELTYVIIWPDEKREVCIKRINSKRTWMTAQAGDAVLLKRENSNEWDRQFIASVSLFRVTPAEFNGTIVESGQSWLDGK